MGLLLPSGAVTCKIVQTMLKLLAHFDVLALVWLIFVHLMRLSKPSLEDFMHTGTRPTPPTATGMAKAMLPTRTRAALTYDNSESFL